VAPVERHFVSGPTGAVKAAAALSALTAIVPQKAAREEPSGNEQTCSIPAPPDGDRPVTG